MKITYKLDPLNVNWDEVKARVSEDHFDNGRIPAQLKTSFENSFSTCLAYADNQVVGKARVLSDGVCNAYIVDLWTFSPYRYQGIGLGRVVGEWLQKQPNKGMDETDKIHWRRS